MYDIRNLNIWKKKENHEELRKAYLNTEITELNLSVRSYNCLKRAGANTIGDILKLTDEEGNGLRKIRNLGSRSEKEILEAVRIFRENGQYHLEQDQEEKSKNPREADPADADVIIIKRKQMRSELGLWETDIDVFDLSNYALTRLRDCGIQRIKDLYATNPKNEPGWYSVRELFEKI